MSSSSLPHEVTVIYASNASNRELTARIPCSTFEQGLPVKSIVDVTRSSALASSASPVSLCLTTCGPTGELRIYYHDEASVPHRSAEQTATGLIADIEMQKFAVPPGELKDMLI